MPRDARTKQNMQLFRDVNERISVPQAGWFSLEPIPFVCECAEVGCSAAVYLTTGEYLDARSTPENHVTIPEHVHPAGERVVAANNRYSVVVEIDAGERPAQ